MPPACNAYGVAIAGRFAYVPMCLLFKMKNINFHEALAQILSEDSRYHAEAYLFLRDALDFASKMLKKPEKGPKRHISAAELLEGIRQYALREYGPLAMTVLNYWGVKNCSDFGRIIFNLISKNILRKTESDSIHDFDNCYDFETAFRKPYQKQKAKGPGFAKDSAEASRRKKAQSPPRQAE